MPKLLFLCSSNSCRSQMAEGFVRARVEPGIDVASAGTQGTRVHPLAVRVMAEAGVDISTQTSKALSDLPSLDYDVVITLCEAAAETCPVLPGHPTVVHWNLSDPAAATGDEEARLAAFREGRDAIRRLVDDLLDCGYLAAMLEAKLCANLILNNISDAIVAHDMDRRIFYFNEAAQVLTGRSRDEVLGRDCHEVFDAGLCGGKCCFPGEGRPAPFEKGQLTLTTKSGERRFVERSLKRMEDGRGRDVGVLLSFRDLTRERYLARRVRETEQFSGMIGRDEAMLDVFELIREVADTNVPVLVQGESGTGKELVAAAIHNEGSRANKLFVPVNCGALPESLLESELFGHVKGAFTGAIRDKKGRFELADGGTIFLDEIGDISPVMQVRLLRVLQEGAFERVGSETTMKVDVRVISATNKDLSEELAAGRFREDLYYRLNVVPVTLPPLRERRNDIPLLVDHILQRALKDAGREGLAFSAEAMDLMLSHDWPGNVRELQNWIQFALVKCHDKVILPEHLPPTGPGPARPVKRRRRRKLSVDAVRDALHQSSGNKVEAARLLGVSRATLYRFLDDAGLG